MASLISAALGLATLPLKLFESNPNRPIPLDHQSVEVAPYVYRNVLHPGTFVESFNEGVQTVHDSFEQACARFASKPLFGVRTATGFDWHSYADVHQRVAWVASGLVAAGLSKGQTLAIYSKNRLEWQLASEACVRQGITACALYDTLGQESSAFIAKHAELSAIVFSKDLFEKSLNIAKTSTRIQVLIQFEAVTRDQLDRVPAHTTIFSLSEIETQGRFNMVPATPAGRDEIFMLMYTSGTTGNPKGVPFTSRNFTSSVGGVLTQAYPLLEGEEVYLSFLPLAHILERIAEFAVIARGGSIGFYSGDPKKILDDLIVLRPTLFAAVPALYDRIYSRVMDQVGKSGALKSNLFHMAYAAKLESLKKGYSTLPYDLLVFNKIRAKFGGRLRQMLSGGAPLRPQVQEFMRVVFGPFAIGYGLTETAASGCVTFMEETRTFGRAGPPVSSVEVKLESVEELGYSVLDKPCPRGEVCVRGPAVPSGYYKDPERTAEAWDADGFFHTGDIGIRHEDGSFSIVDRKKNIVKTSQGEYIALERVESVLQGSKYVQKAWVYADSTQPYIVAVLVLDPPVVAEAFGKNVDELDDHTRKELQAEITSHCTQQSLNGLEIPKKMYFEPELWTPESSLVTPTLKLVRNKLRDHYQVVLQRLYASSAGGSSGGDRQA